MAAYVRGCSTPGAAEYFIEVPDVPDSDPLKHMIYAPHVGWEITRGGLPPEYDEYRPRLLRFLVDMTQPPREVVPYAAGL